MGWKLIPVKCSQSWCASNGILAWIIIHRCDCQSGRWGSLSVFAWTGTSRLRSMWKTFAEFRIVCGKPHWLLSLRQVDFIESFGLLMVAGGTRIP